MVWVKPQGLAGGTYLRRPGQVSTDGTGRTSLRYHRRHDLSYDEKCPSVSSTLVPADPRSPQQRAAAATGAQRTARSGSFRPAVRLCSLCVSSTRPLAGWPAGRMWLYYLVSALAFLVGLQFLISFVLMRVLEELSQREALASDDMLGTPEATERI